MGAGDPYVNFDQLLSNAVLIAREDRGKALADLKAAIEDSDSLRVIADERLKRYEEGAFPSSPYAGVAKGLLLDVLGSRLPKSSEAA